MADSLLAYLATKFASHEENWATEALGYILRRSPVARDTVRDLAGKLGIALPWRRFLHALLRVLDGLAEQGAVILGDVKVGVKPCHRMLGSVAVGVGEINDPEHERRGE